jgi:hypothetical protein
MLGGIGLGGILEGWNYETVLFFFFFFNFNVNLSKVLKEISRRKFKKKTTRINQHRYCRERRHTTQEGDEEEECTSE